ncbi:breast cancer type 2 susceptibility protein isoform X2 [Betta splendens]|uniref:Breast cancer type 2 susceptibility protein isoform X2 n=1 Tax=Betta splendens TaxID=158456 RepID=A0A6P7P1H7_BETSP|nr:breast cancer type 2 susceptibility protein isoform X2 [Betta splendens]
MHLTSKNMYNTFKDEIWEELGPLDPDWFDVLTSQTFPNESNDSDVDELSANQERHFDTAAVASQLFSTPRDFRHNRVVSPKAEDDHSFTHEQENEALAWTTMQSPYLFGMSKVCVPGAKYEVIQPQSDESFDLLQTPIKSPVSYAKQISESLGAQIHPDISWTSSLNTPTAVPPTLILSKTDGSPCPVSVSAEKNIVTVRKLFPSLSNACKIVASPSKNDDVPALQQGPVSLVADQNPEPHDSLQSSLNQSEGVWRQKLPDAIEDGEIRKTVASVLDGAENVLSMFFSNSHSALRKVKTERTKRKHIFQKKEQDCSITDTSATNNGASTEQKVDDQDPGKCSLSPVEKTVLSGNNQWSPLSLSEIPLCTIDTLCHNYIPSTHAENKSLTKNVLCDSGNLARPLLTLTHSGLPKKNSKFIYSVQTLKTEEKEKESQKIDLSSRTLHSGLLTSPQPKVHDLDMSQLCKAFAEDFTQNHFSPSSCLSAMKQAKQNTKQAGLHQDCDGFINRGNPPAINLNASSNGATVSDSGFQSAIVNNSQSQSGFKVNTHRNAPFSSTNKEPGNTHLEDTLQETDTNMCGTIKEELDSGTENGWRKESMSTQCPWSGEQTRLLNCHINASLQEKIVSLPFICPAGLKTASNKCIDTVNLERGFFQENEAEKTNIGHDTKDVVGHESVTSSTKSIPQLSPSERCGNVSCQLTASQKADVTELCTLLEEADSQFEFTQFEAAKLKPHCEHDAISLKTVGKELDPDFLTGIDFDDSFTLDGERQTVATVMPDKLTDSKSNYKASKTTCSSLMVSNAVRENTSTADVVSSESSRNMLTEPKYQAKAENSDINKVDLKNTLTLGMGFKTAGGNVLRVSKQCLRKAKDLFADIEENLNDQKSLDMQRSEIDAQSMQGQTTGITDKDAKGFNNSKMDTGRSGFQMASGKGISVSAKALQEADVFFKDCVLDSNKDMSVKHKKSTEPLADRVSQKDNHVQFKRVQKIKHNFSGEPVRNLKDIHYGCKNNVDIDSPGINNTSALTNVDSSQENKSLNAKTSYASPRTTSKDGSSVCGFSTASGKKVSISVEAMKKAESLLNESHALGETRELEVEVDAFKTDQFVPSKNGGFQTASGKGVVISSEALKKAKSLLSESEVEVDRISVKPYSKMPVTGPPHSNCGFITASGKPAAPSAETLHKAKALFSDIDIKMPVVSDIRNNGNTAFGELSCSGSFCTASGKKVSVSDDAVRKAKSLLGECIEFEETNKKQCKDASPTQNGGFQTASGKRVAVSSSALKKANALLSEVKGVGDKTGVKPTHCQKSFSGPAPTTSGLNAPSYQTGELSSEAVQKAEGLFMDTSAVSESKKTDRYDGAPNITHCGFTTAGGAKVIVSQKGLMKAKSFMKEFDDGDCHHLNSYSSPHDTHKPDPPKPRDVRNSSFKPITDFDSDSEREVDQTILNQGPKSSFLTFQSCNLGGCTETQEKLLAQEALDCTKALLEDEGIADQNHSEALGNVPHQENAKSDRISVEERKGKWKRSVEDTDMTGQPPLKRRLLEEFDRTVEGPRRLALLPERSCPSGVINDRRVFKYSDSLHPNVTKPHSNGKNYVETRLQKATPTQHSTSGDSRPAGSKMPAFVPPFCKNAKMPTLKNTALSDNKRRPAFVPPFKKQESSSKAQEQVLHRLPLAAPSKSDIYVPPVKKAQSTNSVIYTESKDDIQTVVLAGSTNENQVPNPHNPVGCKAEDLLGVQDTMSRDQEFQNLENLELARDMQDMRIRKKKRQTIRPVPGSLFLTKTSGVSRIQLKAAANGKRPARHTQVQLYEYGVQANVSEITSETAENFRFHLQQFFKQEAFVDGGGVHLADGGWLVSSNDGTAGKEEFYRALCDTPGVDPKLISEQWVYNHYRWIVWKQASMERSFPETMGSLCLTPEQVLLQLKYRYDVEVDHSRRPALRKIMERDDTAAKTLVLCVCGVVSRGQSPNRRSQSDTRTPQGTDAKRSLVENPSAVIWLTDGWYAIKAQVDEPLTAMLHKGRLAIGGKLIVHGAQLVGSQDACSPLEAPESLMLKICANSSRPARWDTRLGFYKDPRPFLLPVSCLYSNGGPVGCVDIVILRSYPIQWMERKSDGGVVFRSVRAEEKEARRYDNHKQKAMEIIFSKIQAEFEREVKDNNPQHRRRSISNQDIASLQDGEELHEAVGDDPACLEAHLSEQQLETLRVYRRSLIEKKQAEMQDRYRRAVEAEDTEGICPKRDVTPVWRLYVADSMDHPGSVYQLNLWRPSSDLQSLLKEGCRYKVFNLSTSDGKKRSSIEMIQLTGTNKTQFQNLQTSQEWLSARFQPRVSTSFVDLQNTEYHPLCGEVDVTGCIISVIDEQGPSPAFYLADGTFNFVKVRCFNSFSQSGLEDLVKPCVLLALSNLQLRGQSTTPTSVVYAGDLTIFSTNPKELHLQESLCQLRNLVQGQWDFYRTAEEKLSCLIQSCGLSSVTSAGLPTHSPASITERGPDTKPVKSLGFFTPVNRKPLTSTSSNEKDPKSLKRRRALDYLSRLPSPPVLSHLSSVASPCLKKTFNPPRRSGTPSSLKAVQTPACKPVCSQVENEWVNDEELAMIDTQALRVGNIDT